MIYIVPAGEPERTFSNGKASGIPPGHVNAALPKYMIAQLLDMPRRCWHDRRKGAPRGVRAGTPGNGAVISKLPHVGLLLVFSLTACAAEPVDDAGEDDLDSTGIGEATGAITRYDGWAR